MAKDREQFIKQLVAEHLPAPALPAPGLRALRWFLASLLATGVVMFLVQPYRPGFLTQLVAAPRLSIELVSGLLLAAGLGFLVLARTVPGQPLRRAVIWLTAIPAASLVASVVVSLWFPSPEPSLAGARLACNFEVFVFGAISMTILVLMARKGWLRFSPGTSLMVGLAAGLVPAVLMQVACLYDPWHALHHHYAAAFLLSVLGVMLVKRCSR